MRYVPALLLGGFQLIMACSSTLKVAQTPTQPKVDESIVEKQVVLPEPVAVLSEKKDTVPPPVFKIDTILSVYYGPCYGKCPVYSISITNDGLVYWYGYKNTTRPGSYLTKLTIPQKEQLEAWLADPSLLGLAANYPEMANYIADFPVRQYRLRHFNQTKLIEINHSPPNMLAQLESNLQSWLSKVDWRLIDNK
ncbi:MAG: DUF6438 domain-containing protein [Saprospiraceae bacterium]|nr:DUF6438 domain-containing protein [Saprospiraceae bacterium]